MLIDQSYVVFTGTVIQIKEGLRPWVTIFKIDQSWKRDLPDEVPLVGDRSSCDVFFELGYKYLVLAYEKDGHLSTSTCARNERLERASMQLGLLGPGRPPKIRQRSSRYPR